MARLSVDIVPELHRVIKGEASLRGISIRTFVLDAIHEQIVKAHDPKAGAHSCPLCSLYPARRGHKKHPQGHSRQAMQETLRAFRK